MEFLFPPLTEVLNHFKCLLSVHSGPVRTKIEGDGKGGLFFRLPLLDDPAHLGVRNKGHHAPHPLQCAVTKAARHIKRVQILVWKINTLFIYPKDGVREVVCCQAITCVMT